MIPTAELSFQSVVDDYNFLLNRVSCRAILESKRPLLERVLHDVPPPVYSQRRQGSLRLPVPLLLVRLDQARHLDLLVRLFRCVNRHILKFPF